MKKIFEDRHIIWPQRFTVWLRRQSSMEEKNANEPDQWYDECMVPWCVPSGGGPNWVVRDK